MGGGNEDGSGADTDPDVAPDPDSASSAVRDPGLDPGSDNK